MEVLNTYVATYATNDEDRIKMSPITVDAVSLLEAVVLARQRVETMTRGYYELLGVSLKSRGIMATVGQSRG